MEKGLESNVVLNHKKENNSKFVNSNENISENIKSTSQKKNSKKKRAKKNKVVSNSPNKDGVGPDSFVFDEITNNKEASSLIQDLVKCYTMNSALPQDELNVLNKTLYEKTVSVIVVVLNNCVEKLFNKLLKIDFFNDLLTKSKIEKKNASCQTIISYGISKNGTSVIKEMDF